MILDTNYVNLKNQVIKAERRVLKELGFCVHVKHPHKLIVVYLKYLGFDEDENREVLQMAWNFMNDSFRTDVFVRYQPETIACACIALSARKLNINMSTMPPWYVMFKVHEEDLLDACYRIMELYHRPKPNFEKLEAAVEELKKDYQDQRKKEHQNSTPPVATIVDRSNGSQHAWSGFISRQLPSNTSNSNNDEKSDAKLKSEGKIISSTNNNNEKGKSRSRSRINSRSRSRSSDKYSSSKKKDRARKRTRSRSISADSDYDTKSKKRDKKYSKKSPKRDYREKSRERYSNGRRNHYSDRDKDYNYYKSYDKEKYGSSKHSSSRNGDRHHHKSSRR